MLPALFQNSSFHPFPFLRGLYSRHGKFGIPRVPSHWSSRLGVERQGTASSRKNHRGPDGQDIASDASGRRALSDAGLLPQVDTTATPLASDSSFLMTRDNTSSYLIVKRTYKGQSFLSVNPFQIQKGSDAIAGPVQNCTRMHNGCLLVETFSAVQSEMLLKTT